MDKAQVERQRFDDGLPWYVNGTMEPAERAWMDAYLSTHPEARDELVLVQNMADLFSQPISDPEGDERVIQATLKKVEALQAATKPTKTHWFAWWGRTWAVPTPVFAAVLGAFVAPIWWAVQSQNENTLGIEVSRSILLAPPLTCNEQWRLRIAFGPDIPFDQAVILLRSVNANVVAGPTHSGEFWLRWTTQAERDNAATALGQVDQVHDVFVPPADSDMGCLK